MRGLDKLKISDLPHTLQNKLEATINKYNIEMRRSSLIFISKACTDKIGSKPVKYREYFPKTKKFVDKFSFNETQEIQKKSTLGRR